MRTAAASCQGATRATLRCGGDMPRFCLAALRLTPLWSTTYKRRFTDAGCVRCNDLIRSLPASPHQTQPAKNIGSARRRHSVPLQAYDTPHPFSNRFCLSYSLSPSQFLPFSTRGRILQPCATLRSASCLQGKSTKRPKTPRT